MAKDSKIVVWINGKKTKLKKNDKIPEKNYSFKSFNKEHAAALEDSDIPELTSKNSEKQSDQIYHTRKALLKKFKPFLVASLSAIAIGSVLGLFMLNMFVDINGDINQGNGSSMAAAPSDDDETKDTDQSGSDSEMTLEAVDAFVLQAGKFGEKGNADEMATNVQQAGFSAMIWEKGDFFYVFSGMADSRKQGKQLAEVVKDTGLEVYVKKWTTGANELELSNQEKEWLQMYQKQWNEAFVSVNKGNQLSKDAWSAVIEAIPEDTGNLSDFTEFIKKQHQQIGQTDQWQDQTILLNMWERLNHL